MRGIKGYTSWKNVNSYKDGSNTFTTLMDVASKINPEVRFRFSSPHPKDFPDDLLKLIAERPNLCNYIHIPAQAGSDTMLERTRITSRALFNINR